MLFINFTKQEKSGLDFLKMVVSAIPRWYHSLVFVTDAVQDGFFSRR